MEQDSLLYFNSPKEFMDFLDQFDIYNGWKITNGLLNDRGKEIIDKPYTKEFRKIFRESGFFRMEVSIAEIVSWLDTLSLMRRLLDELQKTLSSNIFNSLSIGFEYMIKMSKKMRVDYIIEYHDKVLLLEFRTVKNFEKIRGTWQNKFQELLVYKELLGYYKTKVDIILYAFIALYEYNQKKINVKHKEYNDNQILYLSKYIKSYLITEL